MRIPVGVARAAGWQWLTLGYRVTGGVSYWMMLSAELTDGDAWVDVVLRAPNARDSANLFRDEPKALDPGKTCAGDGKQARDVEQASSPTMVREWWPFPAHSRSPDPLIL